MLWRGASPAGSNCYCFGGGVCTAPTGFLSGLTRLALAHHGIDSLGSSIQDRVYSVRAPPPFLPQLGRCCQGHNVREYASLSLLYLAHRLAHAPILRLVKKISKQNRDGRVVGIVGIAGGVARCARLAPEGEGEQVGAGGGGGVYRGARACIETGGRIQRETGGRIQREARGRIHRGARPYTERGARPYTQRRARSYTYTHTHTHTTLSLSLSLAAAASASASAALAMPVPRLYRRPGQWRVALRYSPQRTTL